MTTTTRGAGGLAVGWLVAVCLVLWSVSAQGAEEAASVDAVMFRHDARHSGVFDEELPKQPRLKWRFRTGGKVRSSPVVAAGAVCFGSEDGNLYALDAKTGELRWKLATGGDLSSSPAVVGSRVYVVGGDGHLRAVRLSDGQVEWKFQTGDLLDDEAAKIDPRIWDYYQSSPVIDGESILFGGGDGHVYALKLEDGSPRWKFQTKGRVRSTPAVAGGVAYVGSFDGNLYALELASGELKWKFDTEGSKWFSPGRGPVLARGRRRPRLLRSA